MEQSKYLATGITAVKAAETEIISQFKKTNKQVTQKADGSPVTIADKNAEEIIRHVLTSHFPEHGFIGEEYGKNQEKTEYTWVIDPIDGTKNFSRNIPYFATELALFKKNELILGISNAPLLKKMLTAEKGSGAFINQNKRLSVSKVSSIEEAYITIGSIKYFDSLGKLTTLSKLNSKCAGMKGFGDTWSYHFLAEGKLDAIIEAKTNVWDFAACAAIITEAGGTATNLQGLPLTTETKTFLASNTHIHAKLVDFFKRDYHQN